MRTGPRVFTTLTQTLSFLGLLDYNRKPFRGRVRGGGYGYRWKLVFHYLLFDEREDVTERKRGTGVGLFGVMSRKP